jgi:hypothetical protein
MGYARAARYLIHIGRTQDAEAILPPPLATALGYSAPRADRYWKAPNRGASRRRSSRPEPHLWRCDGCRIS